MKTLLLIVILLAASTLTIIGQPKKGITQVNNGKELFNTNMCGACHGLTKTITAHPLQKIRDVRGTD